MSDGTEEYGSAQTLRTWAVIIVAYVASHAAVALLITPVQGRLMEDVTRFASLVYLPHGVRVLSTWLVGWRAVPPLIVGQLVASYLFDPDTVSDPMLASLLPSVLVGGLAALIAFEIVRRLGQVSYAQGPGRMDWRNLILVGAVASILNSAGQSVVYGGQIGPESALLVCAVYMVGDTIGLIVTMIMLMFAFRWARLSRRPLG